MNGALTAALERAAARHHWTPGHAGSVVREYERFMALAQQSGAVPLVPARDVDLLWHEHLAEPSYAQAFERLAPKHDTHTAPDHAHRFERTLGLYRDRFGTPDAIWSVAAECQVDDEPEPED